MITQPTSITVLKQLFTELFLNKTDKVSDISDNSVLNATAFGVAKTAQKALKDIAIVEAKLFPDNATGIYLDRIADLYGILPRRSATGSSTYLRVIGNPGTIYLADTNQFLNNNGILFELEDDFTMPDDGYDYAKVRSIDSGTKTNVDPFSVINITPIPLGHVAVTNEYIATGGTNDEDDEVFRQRIKNYLNILSIGTLEYFNQLFQSIDDRVLRTLNLGTNNEGNRQLAIISQNGIDFTPSELEDILDNSKQFFPITDLNRFGDTIGIELINVTWFEVGGTNGIDFRAEVAENYDPIDVRKNIQINLTKYLDFRFWQITDKVEWDELLSIVKETEGVKYVPDNTFLPRTDQIVPINQLPRVAKFIMRDLDGNIFYSNINQIPVFYPSE